jgi:hypothetical protein
MGRMPFTFPSEFHKEIAETTKKVYKAKLNRLAKEGFETVDSLKKDPKAVIEAIKTITGEGMTDKDQHARRYFLSSIFWVAKFPKKNPYYTYYKKCGPAKDLSTGDKWLPKKKYDLLNT